MKTVTPNQLQQGRANMIDEQAQAERDNNLQQRQQRMANMTEQQAQAERDSNRQQHSSRCNAKPLYKVAIADPVQLPSQHDIGPLPRTVVHAMPSCGGERSARMTQAAGCAPAMAGPLL